MTPKSATKKSLKNSTDMLRDLLITQLGLAGVPQAAIRDIVGGDIKESESDSPLYQTPQKIKKVTECQTMRNI
jgi:hypothetical protein